MDKDIKNTDKMLSEDELKMIAGGKIENADAFIIVFLAYGLKKQGYTLDQCVEELAKGFDKKSTDYLEAIGLIYRAWNLEV